MGIRDRLAASACARFVVASAGIPWGVGEARLRPTSLVMAQWASLGRIVVAARVRR